MVSFTAEEERRLDDYSADATWRFTEAACNPIVGLRSGISLLENRHFHPFESYRRLELHRRKLYVQQKTRGTFYSI